RPKKWSPRMSNPSRITRLAPFILTTSRASTPELHGAPNFDQTLSTPPTGAIAYRSGNFIASGYFRHHAASLAATNCAHGASWYALLTAPVGRWRRYSASSAE